MEPTDKEIETVLNLAQDSISEGTSRYRGMTYEEGIRDAIDWIQGNGDTPLE